MALAMPAQTRSTRPLRMLGRPPAAAAHLLSALRVDVQPINSCSQLARVQLQSSLPCCSPSTCMCARGSELVTPGSHGAKAGTSTVEPAGSICPNHPGRQSARYHKAAEARLIMPCSHESNAERQCIPPRHPTCPACMAAAELQLSSAAHALRPCILKASMRAHRFGRRPEHHSWSSGRGTLCSLGKPPDPVAPRAS